MKKSMLVLLTVILTMFALTGCPAPTANPSGAPTITEDFEGYALGAWTGGLLAWNTGTDITATVVTDPLGTHGNVLEVVTTDYNSAVIVPITIPVGHDLSEYASVSVDVIWSSGDVTFKDVLVYAFAAAPTGAFYNDSQTCTTSNYIGLQGNGVAAADAANWASPLSIAIAGGALTGTIYVPIGTNNSGSTMYIDNITFNP